VGLVLSPEETTGREKIDMQLEKIAHEWLGTFDSFPYFVSIHDTEYKVVMVNRALADELKMQPHEVIGRYCYELFHKAHEPPNYCPHRRTLQTRKTCWEEIFEPSVGLYLEFITLPIFDEKGRITGSVHMVRDITKQKQAQKALEESEKKYRELADLLPQTVFELDKSGRITFANRQAYQITGYTPDDFARGLNVIDIVAPEDRDRLKTNMELILKGNKSDENEYRIVRKDGSSFPALVYSNLVTNGEEVLGIEGILIDFTDQKRLDQLKDEFISLVSHEMRAPLTTIMGSVNMILKAGNQLPKRESRRLLQDAARSSEDLGNILGNLLELSREKAGRLIMHLELTDIRMIARDTLKQLKPRTSIHKFVLNIPRSIPIVSADTLRLKRILYNLLENAVKYSPSGGEIRISAKEEKNELVISVSDPGIGISPDDQIKLFTPFQRLEGVETAGIGLGLVVCRRLVEAHQGRIWVESVKDNGATFFFTLPLHIH